ncbi:MAG: sigma-70 domain-containing protein [Polyangiales bacterium]
MTLLRAELQTIVEQLTEAYRDAGAVPLDVLGEAVGLRFVSYPEVDAMISELESRGIEVSAPQSERSEELLRSVVSALRTLGPQLGRKPSTAEIAEQAGLTPDQVRQALLFAQIMQR